MAITPVYIESPINHIPLSFYTAWSDTVFVTITDSSFPEGDSRKIKTTEDGINWTEVPSLDTTAYPTELIYAEGFGRFLCAVGDESNIGAIFSSVDGYVWEKVTSAERPYFAIAYSPELNMAVAAVSGDAFWGIETSGDGITWSPLVLDTTSVPLEVAPSAVVWAASSNFDSIHNSNWDEYVVDLSGQSYSNFSMCWDSAHEVFCAVAREATDINYVLTSPDGINWTRNKGTSLSSWRSVAYADSIATLCKVSSSPAATAVSTDGGATWTETSVPGAYWADICWSPELAVFCMVGFADGTVNCVATSPNGVSWTLHAAESQEQWRVVAWSPELRLFCAIAASSSKIMTSPDGVTWTYRLTLNTSEFVNVTDLCWSPKLSLFCAVGGGTHKVATSPNGITWMPRMAAGDNEWNGIAWGEKVGKFCAVANELGSTSSVMTSSDGINWEYDNAPLRAFSGLAWSPSLQVFSAIAKTESPVTGELYADVSIAQRTYGKFVVFAELLEYIHPTYFWESYDGLTWSSPKLIETYSIYSPIIWSRYLGKFVTTGRIASEDPAKVLLSDDASNWVETSEVLHAACVSADYLFESEQLGGVICACDFPPTPPATRPWILSLRYTRDGVLFDTLTRPSFASPVDVRMAASTPAWLGTFVAGKYGLGYARIADGTGSATDPFSFLFGVIPSTKNLALKELISTSDSFIKPPVFLLAAENLFLSGTLLSKCTFNKSIIEKNKLLDGIATTWEELVHEICSLVGEETNLLTVLRSIVETCKSVDTNNSSAIFSCLSAVAFYVRTAFTRLGKAADVHECVSLLSEALYLAYLQAEAAAYFVSTETIDNALSAIMVVNEEHALNDVSSSTASLSNLITDGVSFQIFFNTGDAAYTGWVMNTKTFAVTEYENFPFNSFTTHDGVSYGTNEQGLYRLEGDDDAGVPIAARAKLGLTNFDKSVLKRLDNVYIGLRADGLMVLKVTTEGGVTRFYQIEGKNEMLHRRRVHPLAKGHKAVWWQFELANVDGADFEVSEIEFVPVMLTRSV